MVLSGCYGLGVGVGHGYGSGECGGGSDDTNNDEVDSNFHHCHPISSYINFSFSSKT